MASNRRLVSLTRRKDFATLKLEGNSLRVNSWMLVNWLPTDLQKVRCGWTVPRHVGSAVVRNRFKRWGREFLREWARKSPLGVDLNVVLKARGKDFYKTLSHKDFDRALEKLVSQIERAS